MGVIMRPRTILDLMVPLSEYATVSMESTLREAIEALHEIQEYDQSHYRHRAVLVFDKNDCVIGKLSLFDILKSLDVGSPETEDPEFPLAPAYRSTSTGLLPEISSFWSRSSNEVCRDAASLQVADIMHVLTEREYVEETAPIEEALHQLIAGNLQSLIVTRGREITGILKLSDIFAEASTMICSNDVDTLRACERRLEVTEVETQDRSTQF